MSNNMCAYRRYSHKNDLTQKKRKKVIFFIHMKVSMLKKKCNQFDSSFLKWNCVERIKLVFSYSYLVIEPTVWHKIDSFVCTHFNCTAF